ncbi:Sad1-interacting factor 3 [Gaeumannomyces tritici R3-111a-1]|uniref:Sad1-interacting factor 3 n=1 Tax=Gaeumannomyces tritici (strain R3-111a-1) TaxID=644352 RepID=J3P2K9_GAET3|nr:Sad1-interacting factor 3 [Gaeumannomyces tritici R3-111a-1]EJT73901.1 Sad1-interacting factor 3 [Gaeumannomyces tritici R3-111a-1]
MSKRNPSLLVTDSRDRAPVRSATGRQGSPNPGHSSSSKMPMRFVSVDNVLQYASEIPSGQPRVPPNFQTGGRQPGPSPLMMRAGTGGPSARRGSHGGLPTLASIRTGLQNVPSRTTKISEKLVLLPETEKDDDDDDEDTVDDTAALPPSVLQANAALAADEEAGPLRDEELDVLRKRGGIRGKSIAERLPKVQRGERVSRLTAYCTAQAYKMKTTAEFLRSKHGAKAKLYDDCLYTVFHLPLLPGIDGYRVRSRPVLKTPGTGKTVLDLEIERSERRDEHMGYCDEYHPRSAEGDGEGANGGASHGVDENGHFPHHSDATEPSPVDRLVAEAKNFAEMFVFSYGVVVFWNFTESQEKDILADLTFAEGEAGVSLLTRPLDQADFETEEFHFEYSSDAKRPRVFNDMITLLPRSDHMVKLTISHAIAQSTKLCFFEEKMSETMLDAQHVPKQLALTGELAMSRTEIVKILGRLFKSRVDINLSSNILDVPNFFWDSEPTLHPLYVAIRDYLEIDQRIKVLNERCRVFLDLAEILSDSVADAKMSAITWIIIILIVISILVTVSEVTLRFGMLEKERSRGGGGGDGDGIGGEAAAAAVAAVAMPKSRLELRDQIWKSMAEADISLEDLRAWGQGLTASEKVAVCGSDHVGKTFAGV